MSEDFASEQTAIQDTVPSLPITMSFSQWLSSMGHKRPPDGEIHLLDRIEKTVWVGTTLMDEVDNKFTCRRPSAMLYRPTVVIICPYDKDQQNPDKIEKIELPAISEDN